MQVYTIDEMTVEEFTEMVTGHPVGMRLLPDRYWTDERWLFDHLAELTEQHPDHWVAIHNRQVIGASAGPHGLAEAMEQAWQRVDPEEPLVVFFLESKPYVY